MKKYNFVTRKNMANSEWDNQKKNWIRPEIDKNVLKELSKRSTLNGLIRLLIFISFLMISISAVIYTAKINLWLAIPILYVYYFFYGFWVAPGHELQHKTVFGKKADWFSEIVFFIIQTLMWNSPRYARISHRLHHRYTMIRGVDPETDFPAVITTNWMRKLVGSKIFKVLLIGAVIDLLRSILIQINRIFGKKDKMMKEHCNENDIRAIRFESFFILVFHLAVISIALFTFHLELLLFITIAWQVGSPIEQFWHDTEHMGRPQNVNDHRINTRSIKVGPIVKLIFWGLDDHVEHHIFPAVPSRNLPKLHDALKDYLDEADNINECWI